MPKEPRYSAYPAFQAKKHHLGISISKTFVLNLISIKHYLHELNIILYCFHKTKFYVKVVEMLLWNTNLLGQIAANTKGLPPT